MVATPAAASANDSASVLTIDPIQVHHHYTLSVDGTQCDERHPAIELSFTKKFQGGTELHSYQAGSSDSCHVAPDDSKGSLSLKLGPGMADVHVSFRKKGAARRHHIPGGCARAQEIVQPGVATGTFKVAIDGSYFGRIRLRRTPASITRETFRCKPSPPEKSPALLFAQFGRFSAGGASLGALGGPDGRRAVSVGVFSAKPSQGLESIHILTLTGGKSLFSVARNLSSARIGSPGPLLAGGLRFKATSNCRGTRTGTLSGTLKVHFDVIGTQTLKGPSARDVTLSRGDEIVSVSRGPTQPCSG